MFHRRTLQAKTGWVCESPGDIAKHSVWEPGFFIKATEAGNLGITKTERC